MELTMLRQSARRGRLDALLRNDNFRADVPELAEILQPSTHPTTRPTHNLNGPEVATAHASAKPLDQRHYNLLLQYLRVIGRDYNSVFTGGPYALGTLLLPPAVQQPRQVVFEDRTYSRNNSHVGNSHIQFYIPTRGDTIETGYIEEIWELPLEGLWQTFFFVRQHRPLSPAQQRKTPYTVEPCSRLQSKAVSCELSNTVYILEPQHIICHLTTYTIPVGTYGLKKDVMLINWSLNRKRR
jgi:hypothetical protein